MQENENQGLKKVGIKLLAIIILIIVLIVVVIQIKSFQYEKDLRQIQAQYNEEQRDCVAVGTTNNYIYITRTDENKEAIEGAIWQVTTYDGKKKETFETDENGNGGIVGLENGEYYLEEISIPENYTKKDYRYKVILSDYDTSYTLEETDAKDSGNLLLVLVDKEKQPKEGISYNVLNNENKLISTITTNEKGLAGLKNLPDGIYYVQESDNKDAKKYSIYIQNSSIGRIDITYNEEN